MQKDPRPSQACMSRNVTGIPVLSRSGELTPLEVQLVEYVATRGRCVRQHFHTSFGSVRSHGLANRYRGSGMPTLSERIRRARSIAGLTQSQLSKRLGVLRGAVTQWEHPDGTSPSMKHMIAIAQHTGVNLEWLGTGRGEMQSSEVLLITSPANGKHVLDELDEECLCLLRRMPRRMREQLVALMRIIAN